jgi:hypothetical protein
MAEKNNPNKIITISLAIVICIAAIVLLYVNLPQENTDTTDDITDNTPDETKDNNQIEEPVVLLTIIYNNTKNEYTLKELEDFTSLTGTGRYVKSKALPDTVIITPDLNESAWEFTGVSLSTLLEKFEILTENYNITVTSNDNWTSEYTKDQVNGIIDIYNESGNITSTSGATMILAYKQDSEYIGGDYGPLRIAFVGSDVITGSNLWAKFVVSIEIVEI